MNSRILPSVALLIAVGIFFVYVNPTWTGSIAATNAAIAYDDQALVAADKYKAKENALASASALIDQESLTRLSIFLPDSVDNVRLILDINALAARSGLSLSNINVVKNDPSSSQGAASAGAIQSARSSPVGSVDLSLSAVGTYTALHTFLTGVEKSARLLDIKDITVKGSDTGVYTYQMSLRLYWLR